MVQSMLFAPFVEVTRITLYTYSALVPTNLFTIVFILRKYGYPPAQFVQKWRFRQIKHMEVGPTLATADHLEEKPRTVPMRIDIILQQQKVLPIIALNLLEYHPQITRLEARIKPIIDEHMRG